MSDDRCPTCGTYAAINTVKGIAVSPSHDIAMKDNYYEAVNHHAVEAAVIRARVEAMTVAQWRDVYASGTWETDDGDRSPDTAAMRAALLRALGA